MPPVVVAITTAAIHIGAAIAAAYKVSMIVRVVIMIAMAVASSALSRALAKKPGAGLNQGQELTLKLDPTMPRQIAVGRTATGGSQVWAFTFGDTPDVPNKHLVRIITLSDRPIEGVAAVFEGTDQLTFTDSDFSNLTPCTSHHLAKDGTPCLHVRVYKGSDSATADAWLITNSGSKWTSAHKGTGTAYAIVQLAFDPDAFPNGEPNLSFIVDGAHIYDDRESVAEGGTQDLADYSTWTYSRNCSAISAQLLRGFFTNGHLIMGAQADERDIDPEYMIAANNTCDIPISIDAGGTEPKYQAGMMLTATNTVEADLSDLRSAMDGDIYDRGGRITIFPGGTRTSVMDLTDEDINWSEEQSYQPYADLATLFNRVSGSYVPESQGFTQEPYPVQKDDIYVNEDGGQKITITKDFKAVTSDTQVQRITVRILKSSRYQTTIGFVGPLWLYELEQGDWFTITSSRWGFTARSFVAQFVHYTADLNVIVVATETSSSIDTPAAEVPRTTDTGNPVDFTLPVPTLTLFATTYSSDDGLTALPAIDYICSVPDGSDVGFFDLEIREWTSDDSGAIVQIPSLPASQAEGLYTGVVQDKHYQMRARSRTVLRTSDWCDWEDVTTGSQYDVANAWALGMREATAILAQIDAADAAIDVVESDVQETLDLAQSEAEAVLARVVGHVASREDVASLFYIDGEPVSSIIISQTTQLDNVVDTFNIMGVKSADGLSFIMDINHVFISPTEALAVRFSSIDSSLGTNAANITSESVTRATQDTALASSITTLTATVSTNYSTLTASISSEHTAWTNGDTAIATTVTTETASRISGDNTLTASISSEHTAWVSGDATLASSISTLSTTVSGHTTSISTNTTAIATITGQFYGRYMININANGAAASMTLMASSGSGGSISAMLIDVDSFLLKSSSHPNVAPFFYNATDGKLYTDTIIVRTANIADANITTAKIASANITSALIATANIQTLHIANANVTGHVTTNVSPSRTLTTSEPGSNDAAVTRTLNGTGSVTVTARVECAITGSASTIIVRVYKNGSTVDTFQYGALVTTNTAIAVYVDGSPSAGSTTYSVRVWLASGGAGTLNVISLTADEFMK
jgi:hypothetical protein